MFLAATAALGSVLATLGYSLPSWFQDFLILFFIAFVIFGVPKLFISLIREYRENDKDKDD